MKVAFYSPHLCLRGTTVALYDYANHNESMLHNESLIVYHKDDYRNHSSTISRFSKRFECLVIENFNNLDKTLESNKADAVYIIKGGRNDGIISRVCRSLIHCIAVVNEPHGQRYAYGSDWLSQYCSNGKIPAVPYMIDLPNVSGDLRQTLSIPESATVLGRNGGMDSWNIEWANAAIQNVLNQRDDLYFVFQNTLIPFDHPRVIQIPASSDLIWKCMFIQTCDGMIHARNEGESFGQSCGEFSTKNKPIITYADSPEKSHISILGDKGFYYHNQHELENIMLSFKRQDGDWNCYKDYTPEKVMPKFKSVFLD